jgi:hypothetical protein
MLDTRAHAPAALVSPASVRPPTIRGRAVKRSDCNKEAITTCLGHADVVQRCECIAICNAAIRSHDPLNCSPYFHTDSYEVTAFSKTDVHKLSASAFN